MKRVFLALACLPLLTANHADASAMAAAGSPEWPYYGHDEREQRFSPSNQIDQTTVRKLGLAWSREVNSDRGQEATPIEVDRVLYVSTAWSLVYAFDAATGKQLWVYDPKTPRDSLVSACCDAINRGVAVQGGRVYVATIDGRLLAIDARTGKLAWQVNTLQGTPQTMRYTITGAVRVMQDKVVIGNAGGEFGVRGFVTDYDAATGKLAWRFYLTPNPNNKPDGAASDDVLRTKAAASWGEGEWRNTGGGATAWDALTYDPVANLLYIGTGNGGPFDHVVRSGGKGDNLFVASIVAVDPVTGKYVWHYQATPSDSWDYDSTQQIMGARLTIEGEAHDVAMQASKNGYFYVLDSKIGQLLSAKPFVPITWSSGIDMKTGRPILASNVFYQQRPAALQPGPLGAHSWQAMAYSPRTGLVYIPVQLTTGAFEKNPAYRHRPIGQNAGVAMKEFPEDQVDAIRKITTGELLAWDPVAQQARWSVPKRWFANGGALATAGDLVFQGDIDGILTAYNAANGRASWTFNAGSSIIAPPISYQIGDTQYIAVMSGFGGAGALIGKIVPDRPRANGRLLVFKLGGSARLAPEAAAERTPIDVAGIASGGDADSGMAEYDQTCATCHGANASVSYTADLRRSAALRDADLWKSIVIGGALKDQGMVSFKEILTSQQAENIRAYVLREARKDGGGTAKRNQ
jgi:quinohemoprotein ethanol dehydrogenase